MKELFFSRKSPLTNSNSVTSRKTGIKNFKSSFRFVSHPLQLPSPTDTRSLFHKLLIYFHVWKPVARFFEEIIGFDKEMAGVTART